MCSAMFDSFVSKSVFTPRGFVGKIHQIPSGGDTVVEVNQISFMCVNLKIKCGLL